MLARLLSSLGVTCRPEVTVAGRKDLVGGNTEKTNELTDGVLKKCKGGVLLLSDPSSMVPLSLPPFCRSLHTRKVDPTSIRSRGFLLSMPGIFAD